MFCKGNVVCQTCFLNQLLFLLLIGLGNFFFFLCCCSQSNQVMGSWEFPGVKVRSQVLRTGGVFSRKMRMAVLLGEADFGVEPSFRFIRFAPGFVGEVRWIVFLFFNFFLISSVFQQPTVFSSTLSLDVSSMRLVSIASETETR